MFHIVAGNKIIFFYTNMTSPPFFSEPFHRYRPHMLGIRTTGAPEVHVFTSQTVLISHQNHSQQASYSIIFAAEGNDMGTFIDLC